MINTKLYSRVMAAYTDEGEEPEYDLGIYLTPQDTVDNACNYLEYAKRRLESTEWQVYYYYGEAVHTDVMRNPGETYIASGVRLGLSRFQTTVSIRTYRLFRDHIYKITKLSGITPSDLYRIANRSFDRTLIMLEHDFPPAVLMEPELEQDLFLDRIEVMDI